MRLLASLFAFGALATTGLAAFSRPETINNLPEAREALRRTVSPKFYNSLLISPIEGWVVVRGRLTGDHLTETRVVRSEMNGAYDSLALELANNLQVLANVGGFESNTPRYLLVHVLLYEIADGRLAISFANFDDPSGAGNRTYGAAWMAVHRGDNNWQTLEPPWHLPRERRGPRSYMLAVHGPGINPSFRGVGVTLMRPK